MRKMIIPALIAAMLLAAVFSAGAETLDLTDLGQASQTDVEAALEAHPDATEIDLTGVKMDLKEQAGLSRSHPEIRFVWTIDFWNHTISTGDTEVTFEKADVKHVPDLNRLLDCMPDLKSVYMWDAQTSVSDRTELHRDHPDVFFGWTIKIGKKYVFRTDLTAYSTLGRSPKLKRINMVNFTFLPYLKALDIGHNSIGDLEWLKDCAKLKILIAADCSIWDLKPIASQTELEYLELFMNNFSDLTPLAGLTELRDLNLAYCRITDLSPLYDLPHLERVWLMGNWKLKKDEVQRLREHQPNCDVVDVSYGSTGNLKDEKGKLIPKTGWRYHPHYDTIYYIFHNNTYVGWDEPVPPAAKH